MIAVAHPATRRFAAHALRLIAPDTTTLESPQDASDLLRLVSTLQALEVQEPGQQAIRDCLLAKLATVPPSMIRAGRQGGWWTQGGQ